MAIQIIINETGERKELSIIDRHSGVDWILDLIGNSGAFADGQFVQDYDADAYLTDADTYEWWADYIKTYEADADTRDELNELYGSKAVSAIYNDEWAWTGNDYNDHHRINERAAARVKDELGVK